MSVVAMSGADVTKINNRIFADLGDGDVVTLNFPNELASLKTGKNGNSIYAINESGRQCDVTIRVVKGSSDDKYLASLLVQMKANFAGFILMSGEFIKKIGDGTGKVVSDTYIMSGGIFAKEIESKSNVEGSVDQSISVYSLKFSNAPRILG